MQTPQGFDAKHHRWVVSHRRELCCALVAQLPATQETPGPKGTGVEILVYARHSRSSPTQNEQRATMQTPQGLDATHGGELFPIDESRVTSTRMGLGLAG